MKKEVKIVSFLNAIYPPVILIFCLLLFWQEICNIKNIQIWMLAKPTDIAVKFAENIVFSGFVTACLFAGAPTIG